MTTMWRRLVWLMGAGTLLAGVASAADDSAAPEPLDFGLKFKTEYTDNRDSVESDKESNTDFYITPTINLNASTARTKYDFYYEPSYRLRSNASDVQNDDEFLHDLGLRINHDASEQTELRLWEHFAYQDDPSIETGGTSVRDDRSYYLNRTELGLRQNFSPVTYADALGAYEFKTYDDQEVADESDEQMAEAKLALWRQLTRSMGMHGTLGLDIYTYESAIGVDRDVDVYMLAAGIENIFSPEFRGRLDLGIQSSEYDDNALETQVSPYLNANCTISPTPAARIRAGLGHGMRDADVYPFASQLYTEFTAGIDVDPNPLWTIGATATLRLSDYDADSLPGSAPASTRPIDPSGDETTTVLTGFARWNINEAAGLRFSQMYEDVDSDVETSFQENTSTLELILDL